MVCDLIWSWYDSLSEIVSLKFNRHFDIFQKHRLNFLQKSSLINLQWKDYPFKKALLGSNVYCLYEPRWWYSFVQLCPTLCDPMTAARQASLSLIISWSLLKLMSIESVRPSNHLILCCLLLLPPSDFPSIRVFSNESALHIRWPNYWSFNFSIGPSSE